MNYLRFSLALVLTAMVLSACASTTSYSRQGGVASPSRPVSSIPPSKAGMVIIANSSSADREIRIFAGYYKVDNLKTVNSQGNTVLAVPPLNLLQVGWRSEKDLVFKSEEIISPQTGGRWRSNFTIPCNYVKIKGTRGGGQMAVVYLKPNSRYTLYVRDYRVSGGFLGERTIRFQTSYNDTRTKRKTHLGTIWADKIIDLPRADTSGPRRFGVDIIIDPWH